MARSPKCAIRPEIVPRKRTGFSRESNSDRSVAPVARSERDVREDLRSYNHLARLSAAVGLGRVRDASVVHDVYVLEGRLRDTGGRICGSVTHHLQTNDLIAAHREIQV